MEKSRVKIQRALVFDPPPPTDLRVKSKPAAERNFRWKSRYVALQFSGAKAIFGLRVLNGFFQ